MKTYRFEVLYDGEWVEDLKIEAEDYTEAHAKASQQAQDNIEVRLKGE